MTKEKTLASYNIKRQYCTTKPAIDMAASLITCHDPKRVNYNDMSLDLHLRPLKPTINTGSGLLSVSATTTTTTIAEKITTTITATRADYGKLSLTGRQAGRISTKAMPMTVVVTLLYACTIGALSSQPMSTHNGQMSTRAVYVDQESACKWNQEEPPGEVERILLNLRCNIAPTFSRFRQLMSVQPNGLNRHIHTPDDMVAMDSMDKSEESLRIWREYLSFESLVDHFYVEAMQIFGLKEFCVYANFARMAALKNRSLGSVLLSYTYDLLAIEYHRSCLLSSFNKMPKVPYLVRDIVDIYIEGADHAVADLQAGPTPPVTMLAFDESNPIDLFDVQEAIYKNGPLKDVCGLLLTAGPNGSSHCEQDFKQACKNFVIETSENLQWMEMMSKMVSTHGNVIEKFNNFVMRSLLSTKYADICSQLSIKG